MLSKLRDRPVRRRCVAGNRVDWEAELVVVIGRQAAQVSGRDAWRHVAGLTVGQDLSERAVQLRGTPDECGDPVDVALSCELNGVAVQQARTKEMIFPVPRTVALLSARVQGIGEIRQSFHRP